MPPLSSDQAFRFTRRYQDVLEAAGDRVVPQIDRAWSTLDHYDEVEVGRFVASIQAPMGAAKQSAVSVTAGYLAIVLGLARVGVAANLVRSAFDARQPFTVVWHALAQGVPWDEAVEVGRRNTHAMARTYVNSTARQTGDHYLAAARVESLRWRRVPNALACEWCRRVARDDYKTAETADFGHDDCRCSVLPALANFDPDEVVTAATAAPVETLAST